MNADDHLIQEGLLIALEAHTGQIRKVMGDPFVIHEIMVGIKLKQYGFSAEVVAAGETHDVYEDTSFPEVELERRLGTRVSTIVKMVTHDDSLPWEEKKAGYIEQVRQGWVEAKAVCCADKIHNLGTLIDDHKILGPAIWQKFSRGKAKKLWFEQSVLAMLKETWDHPIINEYEELVRQMETLSA